jgi:two-component system, OmpR family, sensor histidine kinase BaeS
MIGGMSVGVHARLFLALLLASLLAVLGTSVFSRWSFERGLSALVNARETERVTEIADRLVAFHAEEGSWERLREDKRLWVALLMGRGERMLRERRGPRRDHLPPWMPRELVEPGPWPPGHALEHLSQGSGPVPVELRLMLIDESGRLIYGREALLAGARRIPLQLDGRALGQLALVPGPPVADWPELEFQARQGGWLWIIAAGMLLVSAALAYPVSRGLMRPLRSFQRTIERLAAGDYQARVPVKGGDEIARLGRDLNGLALALEQHDQARRRWVADISHELRTPIALLRAELEALQDGVRPLDPKAVERLHQDALRLGTLVDDLHQLALSDLGALSYRMAPVDIGEVLETDLEAFRPRFAEAGLALGYEDRRRSPRAIQGDAGRLSQLVRNLLRNSLQYTDPGGQLSVTLDLSGDWTLVDFQDTAPGVPPEAMNQLFERLYRLDQSRSRHTGGSGLGLAIAKNVVEAHGGRISARPSPLGGLWVRLELPNA